MRYGTHYDGNDVGVLLFITAGRRPRRSLQTVKSLSEENSDIYIIFAADTATLRSADGTYVRTGTVRMIEAITLPDLHFCLCPKTTMRAMESLKVAP